MLTDTFFSRVSSNCNKFFRKYKLICQKKYFYSTLSESKVEEIKIPVPWGHISGKWWGSKNQRPILCLHGWQDNANSFDTLIPLLPPENSYLAIDLPGHGISSHFSKGVSYGLTELVVALRRVQKYYNWSKISFIGHSLGSSIGFLFSSFFEKDVDLFVAIDLLKPVSWIPETDFKKLQSSVSKALKNSAKDLSTAPVYMEANLLKKCIEGSHDSLTEKSAKILMKRGTQEIQKGLLRFTRDYRLSTIPLHAFCQRELLIMSKVIETNVLFIKAKSSPFYEKKENIDSVIESLKKSAKLFEYHILPGTHHLHLNTPEIVAPYINSFLDKIQYNKR